MRRGKEMPRGLGDQPTGCGCVGVRRRGCRVDNLLQTCNCVSDQTRPDISTTRYSRAQHRRAVVVGGGKDLYSQLGSSKQRSGTRVCRLRNDQSDCRKHAQCLAAGRLCCMHDLFQVLVWGEVAPLHARGYVERDWRMATGR